VLTATVAGDKAVDIETPTRELAVPADTAVLFDGPCWTCGSRGITLSA
jgi:hypothetical protein